eukprot:PITA_09725
MQDERPIAFESRPIKGKFLHKAIYEKEMLAILHALKKWRPYLMGRHFKVKTDHDSLKYFLEHRLSSKEQQKWVTKMLGYDFEIIYKKGKQNVVADALSRKDEDVEALLCAVSIIQPDWINEAREEWKNDKEVWAFIQKLQQDSSTSDTFSWKNDSLCHHPSHLRENSKVQAMERHIEHQQQVLQLLKDNLVLAQNRMKQQANQHRSERSFDVGDWVLLRLQPYKQMSLKQAKKDNKLSPKYYGPYKVLQNIGTMAYKLEPPAASRLHPIFHVSCLKKVIGDKLLVQTIFPELDEEGKIILEQEVVTETRT